MNDNSPYLPHLSCTAVLVLGLVLPSCASRNTASASAEAPGSEGSVAVYTSTDDEPASVHGSGEPHGLIFGTVVLREPDDEQQEPRYDTVEYAVESLLAADCEIEGRTLYFPYDSAEVGTKGDLKIDEIAECLQKPSLSDEPIEIIGHADKRGSDEYNRELGLDRANSVARELASKGIERSRIETYSRGEFKADDPDLWDDRRVVIRLAR